MIYIFINGKVSQQGCRGIAPGEWQNGHLCHDDGLFHIKALILANKFETDELVYKQSGRFQLHPHSRIDTVLSHTFGIQVNLHPEPVLMYKLTDERGLDFLYHVLGFVCTNLPLRARGEFLLFGQHVQPVKVVDPQL